MFFVSSSPHIAPSVVQTSSAAGRIAGAARVIDGDTIDVAGTRIRLYGIDAPETAQQCRRSSGGATLLYSCGRDARDALKRIIGGAAVTCDPRDRDRYGRTVAVCYARGSDIGREMVRQGWAVAYTRYSAAYAADETAARAAKRALWSGEFEAPEEWRRKRS